MNRRSLAFVCLSAVPAALAQWAELRPAPAIEMPALADCNSPAFWFNDRYHLLNSGGDPVLSMGSSQWAFWEAQFVQVDSREHFPMWIESTWLDPDGTLYGWYHHEPAGLCNGKLTAPKIGAVVSSDGGQTFRDLGIVLESGDPVDCWAQNGFFAGGHGDFSVILDREGKYFYFLFDNYGGDVTGQGVAIARMAFEDRANPAGAVWKHWNGDWSEPGVGGFVTPIFPATKAWQRSDAETLWGPSIHWNTYLESYVVLMNHVCCKTMWPRDGAYISFNPDLSDPAGWKAPEQILAKPRDYYPQVLGTGPGETDTLAGETARFYIHGRSEHTIVFHKLDPRVVDTGEAPLEPLPDPPPLPPESPDPSTLRP